MTTQIQTTAAMRRFNQAVERADILASKLPIERGLGRLYAWLDTMGYKSAAAELKLAGEAVGYFKTDKPMCDCGKPGRWWGDKHGRREFWCEDCARQSPTLDLENI